MTHKRIYMLIVLISLIGCINQEKHPQERPALLSSVKGWERLIPNIPDDWKFAAIPNTPFEMPLPPSAMTENNSVYSSNYNIPPKGKDDPYFGFAIKKSEIWTGSLLEYRQRMNKEYEICTEVTWSEHDDIGIINFIGSCGVTCEQERLLYKGIAYWLTDGCDLTKNGREMKQISVFNVRPKTILDGSR